MCYFLFIVDISGVCLYHSMIGSMLLSHDFQVRAQRKSTNLACCTAILHIGVVPSGAGEKNRKRVFEMRTECAGVVTKPEDSANGDRLSAWRWDGVRNRS